MNNLNMTTNTNTGSQTPEMHHESTKAQQPVTPEPLRPHFCVQRDNDTVVPLIAMDELPDSVVLKGVPTMLTVLEALKARMELIPGNHPARGLRYQLDQPLDGQTVASEQGDETGSDGSPTSDGSGSSPGKGFTASDKKGKKNAKDKALRQPALTNNGSSIIDPLAKKGTIGKKVYCTYWIQTGNCNYMQEGCKYKHEIPKDEETRRAIGFREFPNWPKEELPIQAKPAPALHKPWRRPDGKPEFAGHRASPATVHGTPNMSARGKSQATVGAPSQGLVTNTQYNPHTAFASPHQHFSTQVNHMSQQRRFSQGGQPFIGNGAAENSQQRPVYNNASPPSYNQSGFQLGNGGRSGSSSPPKQPPISRPTNLGQSSVNQQQNNPGASTRRVAPDHHLMNRAGGLSGTGASGSGGTQVQNTNDHQGYNGLPNNWNPQTSVPTLLDINLMNGTESTRSGSQAIYTPNYTSSNATATPAPHIGNAFGSMNGNATSDSRAGTPAHYNVNAFANNGNVPVKGRGAIQFGRGSPAPSIGSARNNLLISTVAEESDATSVTSPPVQHRVFFREPGQPEFVTNPPEPKNGQNGKAGKKHPKKAHGANGTKSAKNKMSGNGYDVLVDMHDHQ